jgi:osmoprotectant transport system ATP-binding protein
MNEAGVEFANVSYAPASQRLILRGISLKLEAGTTTALLGRSGSGKTTLMRMVNGMVMPTGGSVIVAQRKTTDWDQLELRRRIGYVIQESGLFPHWTVGRNAGLALELAGAPNAARVDAVLALAGLDAGLKDRYPWQLSGGQRQRVGLARALAADPEILLMDEPFGALDPMTRAEMQDMLLGLLKQVKKTVLLVTHDLDEALYLAGRVVFLEDGAVVADMVSGEVVGSENEQVRRYVAASSSALRSTTRSGMGE